MVAGRVEDGHSGSGGYLQKFLVLLAHALGLLRLFAGNRVAGPQHKSRRRILHVLYRGENFPGRGRLLTRLVCRAIIAGKDKSKLRGTGGRGETSSSGQGR